jgi:ribonucleoside-triphosphate reductase
VSVAALQEYTFKGKYAGWLAEKKRRETWGESIDRFCDMFLEQYANKPEVFKYVEVVRKALKRKEVLGSQRGLQFGGKAVLKRNARLFNCCFSYCDRPRFFQECMYLLLCGCGAGYSVQKHHVAKLPEIKHRKLGKKTFVIPDSIDGWADAIGLVINSYFNDEYSTFPEYSGYEVEFDFSEISPEGTPLSSCHGKAPGPAPLKKALENIQNVIDKALKNDQYRLTPINCHDIICYFADAVVSGGVRRSALISLFSKDDVEMLECKTGNWFYENPQRGRANNSVVLLKNDTTKVEFKEIIQSVKEFGEPGFLWVDDLEHGVNPCCEISFFAYNKKGESGWQGCNLTTINAQKCKTEREFYRACRNAAIIGTLQAGFTDFPYLGDISEEIFRQEALLGVSMTGIMENSEICLDARIQSNGAEIVKSTNKEIAAIIGINPAARTTCVKPEGTASCVLGTSSGIHPHHAKRYIRRVQANRNEVVYKHFRYYNPLACERSVWSENDTDDVIAFTIEVPDGLKTKNQLSAIELLEAVKTTQQHWVTNGKDSKHCTRSWLNHNVSNTVTVQPYEWDDVWQFIYKNRQFFCGISLLPASGDKDYPQAPFTEVKLPSELVKEYGDAAIFASGLVEKGKELFEDNLWLACDAILGLGEKVRGRAKLEWIEKCKKYANRYLDGDVKLLTYCLKDVDTWKYYVDLKREYVEVDYSLLIEEEDNTAPEQELACSGGQCELR